MHLFLAIIKESVIFAWAALAANRLRTFLSLLGITIGIFSIITVFTIVDSLEHNLRSGIQELGNNVVFIQKWPWDFGEDYPWWKYMNRPVPNVQEYEKLHGKVNTAVAMAFHVSGRKSVKYKNNTIENITITGGSYEYDKVSNFDIAEGRYFTEAESNAGRNICIIGSTIAETLFPNGEYPVGKQIKMAGRNVQVIGVFKKQGESLIGNSTDAQMLVPVNYVRNFVDIRSENLDPYIAVKAKDGITNEQLKDELKGLMRGIRQLSPEATEDFALNETKVISQGFDGMFEVVGLAGWIIGGFSILVGGFGIANIMFVSVRERTSLIGIQKSLGAKNYFILMQFLFESVFLSMLGGLIGLLLIWGLTLLIGDSAGMKIFLSRSNVILGITISFLIGVVSGFVPAYGASQLDPVEAIRSN
ncbi:MAG: ABC transporter permease [Bacteroidetes bacterium]|nr:ABC transporter permease [Bacteroidota bacterium]